MTDLSPNHVDILPDHVTLSIDNLKPNSVNMASPSVYTVFSTVLHYYRPIRAPTVTSRSMSQHHLSRFNTILPGSCCCFKLQQSILYSCHDKHRADQFTICAAIWCRRAADVGAENDACAAASPWSSTMYMSCVYCAMYSSATCVARRRRRLQSHKHRASSPPVCMLSGVTNCCFFSPRSFIDTPQRPSTRQQRCSVVRYLHRQRHVGMRW